MARHIKLIPGHASVLMSSPEIVDFLRRGVDRVAEMARANAKVRTGKYRASIEGRVERRGDRAVGIVGSNDPKAMGVESRTGNLARALGSLRA